MKTDDATIIAQILAGETKEFRHLMRRHGGTLLAFIESVIGSREEAEDIVQETFIGFILCAKVQKVWRMVTYLTEKLVITGKKEWQRETELPFSLLFF